MSNIEKFQFQNVPSTEEGGLVIDAEVRVVTIDGEPWFVAQDITSVLGYAHSPSAVRRLDYDEYDLFTPNVPSTHSGPPARPVTIVNESGLYSLILGSTKPEAKAFKKWVTAVVLPTIRKTGAYVDPTQELFAKIQAGDVAGMLEGLKLSTQIADEALAKLALAEQKIEADAPMVKAAEEFFDMEGLYSLRDSARKFGIPPLTFNDILRGWGWIDERGTAAKAYAVRMEYAKNRNYLHPGSGAATTQGRLTNKGLERAAVKLKEQGVWVSYAGA